MNVGVDAKDVFSVLWSSSDSPTVDAAVLGLLLPVSLSLESESEGDGGCDGLSTPTRSGMADFEDAVGIEEVVSWEGVGMVPWFWSSSRSVLSILGKGFVYFCSFKVMCMCDISFFSGGMIN